MIDGARLILWGVMVADKLYACAAVGHQAIDLYEDDFLHYLSLQPGANKDNLWEVS